MISHAFWQRRFAASAGVLGTQLTLNGTPFTIVGVGPAKFSGVWLEAPTDVWIPLAMQKQVSYSQNYSAWGSFDPAKPWIDQEDVAWLDLIVRAAPGQFEQAQTAFNTWFQQELARKSESIANPEERRLLLDQSLVLEPFGRGQSNLREHFATPLFALMVMVALVLLIACANTANLLLARATSRRREMAVRLSLGASRRRLIQQLLTESFLLTSIAAAAGLLLASWTSQLLVRMTLGPEAPPLAVELDGRVLAFTLLIAVATGILFGLAPAFRATRVELSPALKTATKSVHGGSRFHAPKLLVASQVAVSLLLVVGAALFARSLRNLMQVDLGFEREHLLSVWINPRVAGYTNEQGLALYQRLVDGVEALPGVRSATVSMCGLVSGCRSRSDAKISGYESSPGEDVLVQENRVGDGYFSTVGMRLLEGRDFNRQDTQGSPLVAIVNEAMVRRYFQGRGAIGQRFGYDEPDVEIVGVVQDARVNSVQEAAVPMAFYPLQQRPVFAGTLDVRTAGDPQWIVAEVTKTVAAVDPNLPVERVTTIEEQVSGDLNQERLVAQLTSTFGLLALGLACFGLYGVMSYAVARRTSELGLRMALGAPRSHVLWMVFRESLWLVLAGLALGLPLVLAASRLIAGMLFQVSANDPATLAAATVVLMIVAAIAGYVPALESLAGGSAGGAALRVTSQSAKAKRRAEGHAEVPEGTVTRRSKL